MQSAEASLRRRWLTRLLFAALFVSILVNIGMYSAWKEYYTLPATPRERYHSGDRTAADKIAIIPVHGTIMPPFTGRWLKMIERAADDDSVKAVLLEIDSPGGLVADSDQLYHKLRKLSEEKKKPIAVSMKRIAASGGYYIAMAAGREGRIFAEETTWTGSIGVIIPRYDATELAKKVGIASDPLKTGPLKDALSPFREMTEQERSVWAAILDDAFQRFRKRIRDNRPGMTDEKLEPLATGQIFTAEQAQKSGLVDEIGNEDEALLWLKSKAGLTEARVVKYEHDEGLIDLLIGSRASQSETPWQQWIDLTVPRAMYFCSWLPSAASPATP